MAPAGGGALRLEILSVTGQSAGGWGNFTHGLLTELARRPGIDFTLHLPPEFPVRDTAIYRNRVRHDLPPFTTTFRRRSLHRLPSYARRLDLSGADLVHSLVDFPYGWYAAREAKRHGLPYMISGHGTYLVRPFDALPDRVLMLSACRDANIVTVPSAYTRDRYRAASGLGNALVLRNAVDVDRFSRPAAAEGLPSPAGGRRFVLSVGLARRRKGFDVLLRAFGLIAPKLPDVDLVLIGPGDAPDLSRLARELDVEDRVHLLGQVSGDVLLQHFHACDAFALTPRAVDGSFEGFGIVFLEASAAGKPVVASRSGGVPDAVVNGETGLLVPEEDVDATATALARVLEDSSLAARLGENGRRYAARHTWKWYCDEVVALYRKAVEEGPRRAR